MATERKSPESILAQSGFMSCAITDIDEDPDAPDSNWCIANGNNVNTLVRVDFPTPTGNPTVGVDLQEFRWQVRRNAFSGSGTPTTRAELHEDGELIRYSAEHDVTSDTGEVFSMKWNANEISTPDGSLVEVEIYSTKSGGGPSVRASVDVGAVEWNVDYTEGDGAPSPPQVIKPKVVTL